MQFRAIVKTANVTGTQRARRRLRKENGSGFGIMRTGAGALGRVHIIFATTAGRPGKDVHLHAILRS